ncbi:MAG: ferritin family protein [candidate division KSB1 bacterium]|nr:ferritin family protein [candidate division KSB1 bacterium]MDZ7357902.1 ferritin family protein [candidate division KSB1 bacterium]MDZ7375665.1 ferritin family protein [candidate division KSB1 bacterium]MDZ7401630.1 ferritin family protein [candidate division KSB1 bacterium]
MKEQPVIDVIKGAILLERKGKAFYEVTAKNTQSDAVREIFETMAAEEQKHIEILSRHYEHLIRDGKLSSEDYDSTHGWVNAEVLTKKVRDQISAASYEAAAITAAMAMEENAVNFYSQRAQTTNQPLEKELFDWLSNWEKTHLQFLSALDNELKQSVWYDNRFWPMA